MIKVEFFIEEREKDQHLPMQCGLFDSLPRADELLRLKGTSFVIKAVVHSAVDETIPSKTTLILSRYKG